MKYGYARVSTQDQDLQLQIDALRKVGVDFVFEEKKSGGDARRPVLEKAISALSRGDVFVVYKLDRMARSTKQVITILKRLEMRGAGFQSVTETIDTTTPAGRMMMQIVAAFAEFELAMIRERTKAGLRAAMARGTKPGRPRAMTASDEAEAVRRFRAGEATQSALAREHGTHISSIKRAIRRADGQGELFQGAGL